jgi:hypothetical protein
MIVEHFETCRQRYGANPVKQLQACICRNVVMIVIAVTEQIEPYFHLANAVTFFMKDKEILKK